MTSRSIDREVRALLRRQANMITRTQALATGMTVSALRYRLRPGGPWTAVLPGLYVAGDGDLTAAQREVATLLHVGDGVITGSAALRRQGVRVLDQSAVDVLIPMAIKRRSIGFVHVRRTTRMPVQPLAIGGVRYAPVPRAVADAVWGSADFRSATALVAEAVQRGACTVPELAAELRAGPRKGTAALRAALEEVADGIASVAEADLRKLIKMRGLPKPIWNPRLFAGGVFVASPDAWWAESGVACEVDSRQWHLSPEDWERTQARHDRMVALGILVLHYAPRTIRREPDRVVAEITNALAAGRQRPLLAIRAVPAR